VFKLEIVDVEIFTVFAKRFEVVEFINTKLVPVPLVKLLFVVKKLVVVAYRTFEEVAKN
jgi:hypothetical protein